MERFDVRPAPDKRAKTENAAETPRLDGVLGKIGIFIRRFHFGVAERLSRRRIQ